MGRAGEIPRSCSRLSRYRTPHIALFAQAAWAVACIAWPGTGLSDLMSYFGVASWVRWRD